jgi:hypothetical protein
MKNIKLGDEVRVLKKSNGGDVKVGTVDVITFVDDEGEVRVGNSICNWFLGCNGGKLELVKPAESPLKSLNKKLSKLHQEIAAIHKEIGEL